MPTGKTIRGQAEFARNWRWKMEGQQQNNLLNLHGTFYGSFCRQFTGNVLLP
jgi:hypothetical protein